MPDCGEPPGSDWLQHSDVSRTMTASVSADRAFIRRDRTLGFFLAHEA